MNPDGIAYDDRGSGTPVVLLHGHPFDRSMWAPQLEALSAELRVLAPDLPGFGESAARSDPMTMRAFADAVIELLDRLAIERAVFAGLSMGGLVSMELGLNHPERTAGLVLAATTAAPVAGGEVETRLAKATSIAEHGMLPLAAEMIAKLFGPRASRDEALVVRLFSMMLASPAYGAAAALRGRVLRPDYATLLRSVTIPALIIAGDHDQFSPGPVIAQLAAALPAAELVHLHESGHLPNLEEPEGFNDAVRRFVASL